MNGVVGFVIRVCMSDEMTESEKSTTTRLKRAARARTCPLCVAALRGGFVWRLA